MLVNYSSRNLILIEIDQFVACTVHFDIKKGGAGSGTVGMLEWLNF